MYFGYITVPASATRRNPCITFEDIGLSGETRQDYVKIFNGVGCSSQLGRVGGEQVLDCCD